MSPNIFIRNFLNAIVFKLQVILLMMEVTEKPKSPADYEVIMNEPQPGLNLVSVMKVIVREIEVTHDQIQGYYQENSIDKTLL